MIPHSDGAGVVEAAGEGVDPARVGRRVWVYGAQSYRPFGTAAQQAVDLPDEVSDETGASLGIPWHGAPGRRPGTGSHVGGGP